MRLTISKIFIIFNRYFLLKKCVLPPDVDKDLPLKSSAKVTSCETLNEVKKCPLMNIIVTDTDRSRERCRMNETPAGRIERRRKFGRCLKGNLRFFGNGGFD